MENVIFNFFLKNWERKIVALLTAIIVWLYVSHSITETKVVRSVPIRLINLPHDKTAIGLLSNGVLNKRINLTLVGSKEVIADLEPGDLEVVLDASLAPADDWVVHVAKKNLLSLNPSLDLLHSISQVTHPEFVVKLSPLIRAKIPITVTAPLGRAPKGYEYLDVWPQKLWQEVNGPDEEVHKLQSEGLMLQIDMGRITREELDTINSSKESNEIYFLIPKKDKNIFIPFRPGSAEIINDPWAQQLHITFLRKESLLLDKSLPVRIFVPGKEEAPSTYSFQENGVIGLENNEFVWKQPLYVQNVSKLFLQIVKNYIEITIEVSENPQRFNWTFDIVNSQALEYKYVKKAIAELMAGDYTHQEEDLIKKQKDLLRKRFREYCRKIRFFKSPSEPLSITIKERQGKLLLNAD